MALWIIAAIASAVLLAGVAFLALRRSDPEENDPWGRPRKPATWSSRPPEPGGTTMGSIPPPGGFPLRMPPSEELNLGTATESQEVMLFEADEPTGPVPRILVSAAGRSDAGRRREHNEDVFLLMPEHDVYVIADGMGGYAAGEVAAELTARTIRECYDRGEFSQVEADGTSRRAAELAWAVKEANARVRAEAARDARKTGMGTTVVAARFSAGRRRVHIAHVGDSRCYRIRDGAIAALTTDHTLGSLGITGSAAHKLSRAVGVFDHVEVELTVDEPQPGDFYLLCSDGLYKMLSDAAILELVEPETSVEATVDRLVDAANERGGRDNVSVILVRIDEPNLGPDRKSGQYRLPG